MAKQLSLPAGVTLCKFSSVYNFSRQKFSHDSSGNPIVIPNELQKVTLPLNNFETCVGYWGDPEVNPILGKYTPRMQCCGGQGT